MSKSGLIVGAGRGIGNAFERAWMTSALRTTAIELWRDLERVEASGRLRLAGYALLAALVAYVIVSGFGAPR